MAKAGELTLEDAQALVQRLAKAFGVTRVPRVTTTCPWAPERVPWGKVVGAFHPLIPDVICVRNLKPETVAHEFGHFYYHWYVAPALGRYDEAESEKMARRFERLAKKISFKCQVCGGAVLMKSERPRCSWCGAVYQVAPEDLLARCLVFGSIAAGYGFLFTFLSTLGMAPITLIGKGRKKGETVTTKIPPGVSPLLIAILTAGATHITYEAVKRRMGWT